MWQIPPPEERLLHRQVCFRYISCIFLPVCSKTAEGLQLLPWLGVWKPWPYPKKQAGGRGEHAVLLQTPNLISPNPHIVIHSERTVWLTSSFKHHYSRSSLCTFPHSAQPCRVPSLCTLWWWALFSLARWILSRDHLIKERLVGKDKKRPQVENLPPMRVSFILHMQMTMIKPQTALALLECVAFLCR